MSMKKVFFLVNTLKEFNFQQHLSKYLSDVNIFVGESLPANTDYDLIILWNYRKILKNISDRKNVILFHSTNLPEGKGWAPIYYTLIKDLQYYTISGIFAVDNVDSGDIIIQAKFKIKSNYTAETLREWDDEICIILLKKILEIFQGKEIKGKKQKGISSIYPRRKPEDNEINLNVKFIDIINHLRACEKNHPAFFVYNETKYFVKIEPEIKPTFPDDLEIILYDDI